MRWAVEHLTGPVHDLHHRALAVNPTIAVCRPESAAVVLGRAQPDGVVDLGRAQARGLAVVRRPSGGGAVMVEPGAMVWVDVDLPRNDALWDDDVGRAFWWLGEAWAEALGLGSDAVHRGAMVRTPWSGDVCFAGIGPGEVIDHGSKIVGLAQRRTRQGARFAGAAVTRWDPAALLDVFALNDAQRHAGVEALAGAVRPVSAPVDAVAEAVVTAITRR